MTTVKSPAEFPKVLSADAELVRNIWKHSLHDDTGRLSMSDDGFSYEGPARKLTVSWESVQNVRKAKQSSPWALQVVCAVLSCSCFLAGGLTSGDFLTTFFVLLPVFGALFRWVREPSLVSWVVVIYGPSNQRDQIWMTEAAGWWDSRDSAQNISGAFQARLPSNVVSTSCFR